MIDSLHFGEGLMTPMANDVTRSKVLEAFRRFDAGERPFRYVKPKSWYVLYPSTGALYPLKGILALATDGASAKLHTHRARIELERLGFAVACDIAEIGGDFQTDVANAMRDSTAARLKRLAKASRQPKQRTQLVTVFVRNPDVVAQALEDANGKCGRCDASAPFVRALTKAPYLEVHHRVPLSLGGDDHLDNVIALCPNCHREVHHG